MAQTETNSRRMKTVQTAFALLETIREADGITLTELTNAHNVSKSSVYHHLKTLEDLGCVHREDNKYYLGLGLLALGKRTYDRLEVARLLDPEARDLAKEIGGRVVAMVEQDNRGYLVYQHRTNEAVITDTGIGDTVHFHCTAIGKAYLAAISEEKQREIVESVDLVEETADTITSRRELYEELKLTRKRGYSINDEERIEGMRSVGAPIVTEGGKVLGSLSLSLPITRMKDEDFRDRIPRLVKETTSVIAIKQAYEGPTRSVNDSSLNW